MTDDLRTKIAKIVNEVYGMKSWDEITRNFGGDLRSDANIYAERKAYEAADAIIAADVMPQRPVMNVKSGQRFDNGFGWGGKVLAIEGNTAVIVWDDEPNKITRVDVDKINIHK